MAVNKRNEGILNVDKELRAPEQTDMSQLLTEHMVDIFVGAEQKRFHLHRDLLYDRSNYFRACFEGSFREAHQGELFLPEDNPGSFDLFVRWLYGAPLKKISSDDEMLVYLALVILANKLCLEYLHNEVIDHVLSFHRANPSYVSDQDLHYIYQNTSGQDRIRNYLVAHAAWMTVCKQADQLTADYQRLIREGGDLAVNLTDWLLNYHVWTKGDHDFMEEIDPRKIPDCARHKHDFTTPCNGSYRSGIFS